MAEFKFDPKKRQADLFNQRPVEKKPAELNMHKDIDKSDIVKKAVQNMKELRGESKPQRSAAKSFGEDSKPDIVKKAVENMKALKEEKQKKEKQEPVKEAEIVEVEEEPTSVFSNVEVASSDENTEPPKPPEIPVAAEGGEEGPPEIPPVEMAAAPMMEPEKEDIGKVASREIVDEMQQSYLDYAMSVIISRALPDVRDGLKPVHRRILYAMNQIGLKSTAKYRKSATVFGEVLGKYHPHGDIPVYDALVRMAQDFNMRYPLVDGQGNFGSIDGDPPAAMRYTECKMEAIAEEMLLDIEKETIDFVDNYDATQKEPLVLPSKLPNLLLNGSLGIAVGMATNIPPHNLGELCDGIIYLIDNPEAQVEDLMQFVQGPDFPTGGVIYNIEEIRAAYATGKGHIVMRAVAEVVEDERSDKHKIVITEIPYQVNKAQLIEKIAELVAQKKIVGLSDIRDESDRAGLSIVIELKRDAYPQKILNQLYKMTQMQETFHVNMLALVDGIQPHVLTLKNVLEEYIKHRQSVVTRRAQYDLRKALEREHILEGLSKALDHIDEVINTIRESESKEDAKVNLIKKFKFTDIQAQAILEMRLAQLAALERKKIEDELSEVRKLIADLKELLASEEKIKGVIKTELLELKEKFGDKRRTRIVKRAIGEFSEEDLIPNEEVIVTLTRGNYIKRMPTATYRSQARGGKGVVGVTPKEEDVVEHLRAAWSHDNVLFFTNKGRVFQLKVYEIPQASRIAKGTAIINLIQISSEEKVTSMIIIPKAGTEAKFMFMCTKKGIVKKSPLAAYANVRRSGIIAIKLDVGDQLDWVRLSGGEDTVIIVTENGQAIHFKETDVRPMGRASRGVRGIRLRPGDRVMGMDIVPAKLPLDRRGREVPWDLLIVTERGLGKKTTVASYGVQKRGGIGLKTLKITPRTGKVISMQIVGPDITDLVIISRLGQVIRLPFRQVPRIGRATQGVTLMRMKENDQVASVTAFTKGIEEEVPAEVREETAVE